jgi:ketosteroid isomerase-like protein
MSQENVEMVREIYRGWARGDFSAGADVLASDFEYRQLPGAVEPGSPRGAEVGRALRGIFDVYEDFRVDAEEYIDAGEQVVVVARSHGTARGSRMQLEQRFAFVWTVKDGKLARTQVYPTRREALGAIGLAE